MPPVTDPFYDSDLGPKDTQGKVENALGSKAGTHAVLHGGHCMPMIGLNLSVFGYPGA